jgi:hypothetical protein
LELSGLFALEGAIVARQAEVNRIEEKLRSLLDRLEKIRAEIFKIGSLRSETRVAAITIDDVTVYPGR